MGICVPGAHLADSPCHTRLELTKAKPTQCTQHGCSAPAASFPTLTAPQQLLTQPMALAFEFSNWQSICPNIKLRTY